MKNGHLIIRQTIAMLEARLSFIIITRDLEHIFNIRKIIEDSPKALDSVLFMIESDFKMSEKSDETNKKSVA